jgi:hypothetical protein
MFIIPVRLKVALDDEEPVPAVVRFVITQEVVAVNRPVPVVFKFVVVNT